ALLRGARPAAQDADRLDPADRAASPPLAARARDRAARRQQLRGSAPLAALIRRGIIGVTRLRLDAALYEPAPPRQPGTKGRSRKKGDRLPSLAQVLTDA